MWQATGQYVRLDIQSQDPRKTVEMDFGRCCDSVAALNNDVVSASPKTDSPRLHSIQSRNRVVTVAIYCIYQFVCRQETPNKCEMSSPTFSSFFNSNSFFASCLFAEPERRLSLPTQKVIKIKFAWNDWFPSMSDDSFNGLCLVLEKKRLMDPLQMLQITKNSTLISNGMESGHRTMDRNPQREKQRRNHRVRRFQLLFSVLRNALIPIRCSFVFEMYRCCVHCPHSSLRDLERNVGLFGLCSTVHWTR